MGDPRRLKKKYKAPKKLWDKDRIKEESQLKKEYGLKNMRELWIAQAELRRVRREARRLLALSEEEREKQSKYVLKKLARLGILPETATIDDVLSLDVRAFLERRLQTLVYRKGLAKTIKQARQFIVHGHIAIDGRRVDVPSYLVTKEEEDKIGWYDKPMQLQPPVSKEAEESKEAEGVEEAKAEVEANNEVKG